MSTRIKVLLIAPTGQIYTGRRVQETLKKLLLRHATKRIKELKANYFFRMRELLNNPPNIGWVLRIFHEPRNLRKEKSLYQQAILNAAKCKQPRYVDEWGQGRIQQFPDGPPYRGIRKIVPEEVNVPLPDFVDIFENQGPF